ncbi:hypothetical protein DZC30_06880 [Comamonas testosteroni]|uniref:Two-component sensor histidine kinase n=1 Tax=Comamonas testosteroni TaxID=285 RepID=A0A373FQ48_COMTE|nr:hypothetical protein [Comamonas testosteroni]RGE45672.1 hypothetical protein DZC30_06880 [Comamonas testosteroni]
MSTRAQLSTAQLLCMAALLAALTALYWHFSSAQAAQLAHERNHFLLQSLRKTAEDYLATGMTAEQMPAMQDVIDREKSSFAQVMAIDLFTPQGRISYSTDAGARDVQVPADWVEKLSLEGSWETLDPTQDQLGMRFENHLGRAAGGIVVTLLPADQPWTLAQWQRMGQQALWWLMLAAACCITALCLGLWLLQRSLHPYHQAAQILNQGTVTPALDAELRQAAEQAAQQLQTEYAQSQQALQKLQELDRA